MKLKTFNNWRIGTRLYLAIGLFLLMLLALGLLGLQQANTINQRVKQIYSQELLPLHEVDGMKAVLYRVRDRIARHLLQPPTQDAQESAIEKLNEQLATAQTRFRQNSLDEQERRLIDNFSTLWTAYLDTIQREVLPPSRSGQTETALVALYGPALEAFRKAEEALGKLIDQQLENARSRHDLAEEEYRMMRNLTIGILLLGLLTAGFLGGWLVGNIRRPLTEVRDVLRKLNSGDLTHRVQYQSDDELGQMANDLNNALANQRKMIDLVLRTVEQLAAAGEEMSAVTDQTMTDDGHSAGGGQQDHPHSRLSSGSGPVYPGRYTSGAAIGGADPCALKANRSLCPNHRRG